LRLGSLEQERALVELPAAPDGPVAIHSNTTQVQAMAGSRETLWVATRGGLEQYDLSRRERVALYSSRDGLPSLVIEDVALQPDGWPVVTTPAHRCALRVASRRFACAPHARSVAPAAGRDAARALARAPIRTTARATARAVEPDTARALRGRVVAPLTEHATERGDVAATPGAAIVRIEGSAVTAHYRSPDGRDWYGTAGLGVWERAAGQWRRLTPTQQIASNHVVAIAEWNLATYFATFDRGLSRFANGRFSSVALGPTFLNDIVATPKALYVATSEGLYVSADGEHFRRDTRVTEGFVTDLAYAAAQDILYATATNSLWEVPLGAAQSHVRSLYLPGGSRSVQAVDVSQDGSVYLATEDRGVMRRAGKRRFELFDRLSGAPTSWATDVLAIDATTALFGSLRHGAFTTGNQQKYVPSPDPWILFLGRDSLEPQRIFVGTQGGAAIIDGSTMRTLAELPNPCVHVMARLSTGLWVGTEGGLGQYR
jgi:ligand-binding sensor domain-containing protein